MVLVPYVLKHDKHSALVCPVVAHVACQTPQVHLSLSTGGLEGRVKCWLVIHLLTLRLLQLDNWLKSRSILFIFKLLACRNVLYGDRSFTVGAVGGEVLGPLAHRVELDRDVAASGAAKLHKVFERVSPGSFELVVVSSQVLSHHVETGLVEGLAAETTCQDAEIVSHKVVTVVFGKRQMFHVELAPFGHFFLLVNRSLLIPCGK